MSLGTLEIKLTALTNDDDLVKELQHRVDALNNSIEQVQKAGYSVTVRGDVIPTIRALAGGFNIISSSETKVVVLITRTLEIK